MSDCVKRVLPDHFVTFSRIAPRQEVPLRQCRAAAVLPRTWSPSNSRNEHQAMSPASAVFGLAGLSPQIGEVLEHDPSLGLLRLVGLQAFDRDELQEALLRRHGLVGADQD